MKLPVRRTEFEYAPLIFAFSIFLYPLVWIGHTLYLFPQLILTVYLIWSTDFTRNENVICKSFLTLAISGSIVIAAMVELFSGTPSYELVGKLLINGITVCVVSFSNRSLVSRKTISHLTVCVVLWAAMALGAYIYSGTDWDRIVILFATSDTIGSTSLYQFASPLEAIFLTKNISAMFVVSTFCLFLFCHLKYKRPLSVFSTTAFSLLVIGFASRQAILSIVASLVIFRLLQKNSLKSVALIGVLLVTGSFFFTEFVDVNSSGDGASQRLELWTYFFHHFTEFSIFGYGLVEMNNVLNSAVGIDNFHMFFMNQIGAYGLIHFAMFSVFSALIISSIRQKRAFWILIAGYYLNVLFQTYGYEYGNLFLFAALVGELHVASKGHNRRSQEEISTGSHNLTRRLFSSPAGNTA